MPPDTNDPPTRRETEVKALEVEFARGQRAAATEARFVASEREISYLKGSVQDMRLELEHLREDVHKLTNTFAEHIAVGMALAQQVKENSVSQVTKKNLYLSLIGAIVALGMLLIAGIALIKTGSK